MTLLSRQSADQYPAQDTSRSDEPGRGPGATTPDELAVERAVLWSVREETVQAIAVLKHDLDAVVRASADANADDEHDPEGSTVAFERAQLASLIDSERHALAEIDSALGRLDTGSYGSCEACGATITPERLVARPASRRCVACAATHRIGGSATRRVPG